MKKVAAIYTGYALVGPGREAFQKILPDVEVISILDDSIISEVIANNGMTHKVLQRMYRLCESAVEQGADVILETCSSIGDSIDILQPFFSVPIVRIDQPMIENALAQGGTIGVLATVATTLKPTCDLAEKLANEQGKHVQIQRGLAEGAFEAITQGDMATHDALILQQAKSMKDCDLFLLAQGSMARMDKTLEKETGKPIFTSLERGIESLRAYL